ncbi:MAG: glucose 1-dehydrogenase [Pseudonocardiales bacterium]|nr:glucose 1-dehydrogenase [Pseudonocardiales bacterium]
MLEDRICLVTGASQGMGRAAAIEMARQGAAAVAVLDVQRDKGEETAALVREAGAKSVYIACDLRRRDEIAAAVATTVEQFGGLDVLHNNAGVLERTFTNDVDFDTLPEELWDLVMDINLKAVWLMSRFAAPHLRRSQRTPAIVNAASTAGYVAYSHAIYGVSKAALIQLTKTMAVTMSPEVRVNCYSPGTIDTEMSHGAAAAGADDPRVAKMTAENLIPRRGTVEEVAKLVCFLASPDASFITGASYLIDGGSLAWRGARG